ncbi:MAG: CDP-diacylglycerol--glycerol-3-phosphate 3-phosphatidyltransferase [Neisseriaceae bacterium]|nr:MAG: CDP-diacylglycerol--glycerol-3-phosphate 3-phosphatidyltransferase [Neisseriaceae bacterium]
MLLKLTIPNILTTIRVALIPIFVIICYLPVLLPKGAISQSQVNFAAALTFAIAGITDWLDGMIARKWNQTTELGAFLDPVADKLLVACALILLVRWDRTYAFLAIIIISREICVSSLRELMARKNRSNVIAVAKIGKWKTAAQMTAIIMLLLGTFPYFAWNLHDLGNTFLVIAVILTIISFAYYVKEIYLDLRTNNTA